MSRSSPLFFATLNENRPEGMNIYFDSLSSVNGSRILAGCKFRIFNWLVADWNNIDVDKLDKRLSEATFTLTIEQDSISFNRQHVRMVTTATDVVLSRQNGAWIGVAIAMPPEPLRVGRAWPSSGILVDNIVRLNPRGEVTTRITYVNDKY